MPLPQIIIPCKNTFSALLIVFEKQVQSIHPLVPILYLKVCIFKNFFLFFPRNCLSKWIVTLEILSAFLVSFNLRNLVIKPMGQLVLLKVVLNYNGLNKLVRIMFDALNMIVRKHVTKIFLDIS